MGKDDLAKLLLFAWAEALFRHEPGYGEIDFSLPSQDVVEALNRLYGERSNILTLNLRWEMLSGKLMPMLIEGDEPGADDGDFALLGALVIGAMKPDAERTVVVISPSPPPDTELEEFVRICTATVRMLPLPPVGTKVGYHGRSGRRTMAALTWREHPDGRSCVQFWFPPGNAPEAAGLFMRELWRRWLDATRSS